MKLSDAIRLGAMMGPQIFGLLSDGIGTCANGAALLANGMTVAEMLEWPWNHEIACRVHEQLEMLPIRCPECKYTLHSGSITIVHLNNFHHWTREQIADWVALVEPEEVHASETNGQCSLGKGPIGPSLEEVTAVTIAK